MVNRIVIASFGGLGVTMFRLHKNSRSGFWFGDWREDWMPEDFDQAFDWTGGNPVESILEVLCSEGMISWN